MIVYSQKDGCIKQGESISDMLCISLSEATTGGVLGASVFLWILQNFLRTPFFTEQLWATASVVCKACLKKMNKIIRIIMI